MCGISVVLHGNLEVARKACGNAVDAMVHRGPDGDGLLSIPTPAGTLVLGHRRLAILDLTPTGRQPMQDHASGNAIVFNGEIYNFRSLRQELTSAGRQFRGTSDTEVLLVGYQHWGVQLFDRIRGMFALAIWDSRQKRLVLARDHAGMKPLYWYRKAGTLVVASELRAVLRTGLVATEVDRGGLATLLAYGSVLEPRTIVRDVCMFEPASYAVLELNSPKLRVGNVSTFWQIPTAVNESDEYDFASALNRSVRGHLESDVSVGIFLSGGIDSTAVAETARNHSPSGLNTFTIGFPDDAAIDETSIADETARHLGANHQTVNVSNAEAIEQAERWIAAIDQPSLDGFNTYLVARAARQTGLKVALSGLGGDELFGGYSNFRSIPRIQRWSRFAGIVPQSVRRFAVRKLVAKRPWAERAKATQLAGECESLTALVLGKRRLFCDQEIEAMGFQKRQNGLTAYYLPDDRRIPEMANGPDLEAAISSLEMNFYMRDTLLRDSDVSGMAHGFEIRLPLLDRDLMEAALCLPAHQRMSQAGINKPVLVQAAGDQTKRISRLTKRGFSLPYSEWLRGPLRELFVAGLNEVKSSGLVDPSVLEQEESLFWSMPSECNLWSRFWMLGVLGNWLKSSVNKRE